MIRLSKISYQVNNQKICDSISMDFVDKSQLTVISGPSGSGKSLLFSIMSGITQAQSGDVFIDKQSLFSGNENDLLNLRKKIAVIFQVPAIISNLSVFENLKLVANVLRDDCDAEEKNEIIRNELANFDLLKYQQFRPDTLSRNQLFLLALCRVFIAKPDYLFWDDPMVTIDEQFRDRVQKKIIDYKNKGVMIIFFSNRPRLRDEYGDRILTLEHGKLIDAKI